MAWNLFLKNWIVLDFLQKTLQWFSNIYLRVQSKKSGSNFFFLLLRFFSDFEAKKNSDFWPKNFKNLSKLTSVCADEQFLAWNLFLKNWIVLDFLQKTLQWFSNIYLRVQSKKSGSNFFFFSSDFFRILREKNFRFLAKKLQEFVKTNFCVCRRTIFGLKFFFKRFEQFWIFCRNLWHASQTSIFVSRVKIPEEIIFLISFSEFFRILSENFFRLLAKKLQEVFKTAF